VVQAVPVAEHTLAVLQQRVQVAWVPPAEDRLQQVPAAHRLVQKGRLKVGRWEDTPKETAAGVDRAFQVQASIGWRHSVAAPEEERPFARTRPCSR
jgi:hypothetical protein